MIVFIFYIKFKLEYLFQVFRVSSLKKSQVGYLFSSFQGIFLAKSPSYRVLYVTYLPVPVLENSVPLK